MKHRSPDQFFRLSRSWLLAGIVSLSTLGIALPAVAQQQVAAPAAGLRAGTAKVVTGRVTVSDGGAERPLAPGDAVSAADRIATGPESSASVVLRDGTVMVVGPSSRLELREFAFDSTTYQGSLVVGVLRGTMRMVSGMIRKNNADSVRIETPTALIGIRGTDFIVDVDPAGETK